MVPRGSHSRVKSAQVPLREAAKTQTVSFSLQSCRFLISLGKYSNIREARLVAFF